MKTNPDDQLFQIIDKAIVVNIETLERENVNQFLKNIAAKIKKSVNEINGPVEIRWINIPDSLSNPHKGVGAFIICEAFTE